MRAKKFGVTDLSSDAKKLVRAERFGAKDNFSSSPVLVPIKSPGVNIYFIHYSNKTIFFRHPTILMYLNKGQKDLEVQYLQ